MKHLWILVLLCATYSFGANFTILHKFSGHAPEGPLVLDTSGSLYGNTYNGGAKFMGSIFKMVKNPDGAWKVLVLHSFHGPDGERPGGGLVMDAEGNLYGTTQMGGKYQYGVVFKLTPQRKLVVLHSFQNDGKDGLYPAGWLQLDAQGNVYGTTGGGGPNGAGTVYRIDPKGNETILYSFWTTYPDGNDPAGVVFGPDGSLYGATYQGGGNYNSVGSIFKLANDGLWTYSILFSFQDKTTGCNPLGNTIIDAQGNLYGTTGLCEDGSFGVLYELSYGSWQESIVYQFGDTYRAGVNLILDGNGNFYGTVGARGQYGFGGIFELSGGNLTNLHSFTHYGPHEDGTMIPDGKGGFYGALGNGKGGQVFSLTP